MHPVTGSEVNLPILININNCEWARTRNFNKVGETFYGFCLELRTSGASPIPKCNTYYTMFVLFPYVNVSPFCWSLSHSIMSAGVISKVASNTQLRFKSPFMPIYNYSLAGWVNPEFVCPCKMSHRREDSGTTLPPDSSLSICPTFRQAEWLQRKLCLALEDSEYLDSVEFKKL